MTGTGTQTVLLCLSLSLGLKFIVNCKRKTETKLIVIYTQAINILLTNADCRIPNWGTLSNTNDGPSLIHV